MPLQNNPPDDKRQNGLAIPCDKLLQPPSIQQQQEIVTPKPVEEETPTADVVVPLDGGWGWVVVAASFFCNLIVDGIVMNASLISTEIGKEFKVTTSEVNRSGSKSSHDSGSHSNQNNRLYFFYLNTFRLHL